MNFQQKINLFKNAFIASRKKIIGHFLMLFSTLALVTIYYPLINLYLNPPKLNANLPLEGYFLTIPKIQAQGPIIEKVDPFNETEYKKALEKGIAQSINSKMPGENGTVYLFAHSSDSFWRITSYNTIFLKLDDLQKSDEILITKNGQIFKYKVREKKIVSPTEIQYLLDNQKNQLILQTCTPIGTSLKRLLVFADPL